MSAIGALDDFCEGYEGTTFLYMSMRHVLRRSRNRHPTRQGRVTDFSPNGFSLAERSLHESL